jgi:putative transcriptional regulator
MRKISTTKKAIKGLRRVTAARAEAAAHSDPDAQPLGRGDLRRMRRTPPAKVIRRALGYTQEEFSTRYHIPIGTLRDWEQGRAEPDQPARSYLRVIAHNPDAVEQALKAGPG